ncbi:GAF domain-containing protein, partial [Patescibacteria group bacterium]|nr:GAF domain-containing protein [Patescibacteria group bacterium]
MQFLNIYNLAPLVSSILFLFLGLFVFLKNKKSKINFTFFLVCLVTFWWQFSWVILFGINSESVASYLVKIGYVGIIFIPITFYHFFVHLIGKERPVYKFFVSALYIVGVLFVYALFFTDYFISGFYRYFWGFYPKAGPLHLVYLAFLSVLVIVIFRLAFRSLQEAKEISSFKFYQIKYVLLALVFYIFAASDFVVNYGVEFYPIGFLFILIFLVIFAYTIVRHRLMDIKAALRRSFVYLFSVTAIIVPAFIILYYLDRFWPQYVIYASLGILVLAVLVFSPIRNYYYRVANKYFFSSLYDGSQIIAKLSDGLRSTLDVQEVYNLISDTLVGSMRAKAVAILNYDEAGDQYALQYNNGFELNGRKLFGSDKDLHKNFIAKSKSMVVEEIKSSAYQEHKAIIDLLTSINAAVIVPLNIKDEALGIIALGQKESGDMYNDEDIKTLEVIASQSAIAIKNAQLYEETKRFSQTLQAEVERQ